MSYSSAYSMSEGYHLGCKFALPWPSIERQSDENSVGQAMMNSDVELRQMIVREIAINGESAINDMIAERREESLHLEFKTLSTDANLTRDDRKMLAKAICGMANAEGGILIVGIETRKHDGVDAAFAKHPIDDLNRFRRLISAALPEMLSPQHSTIQLLAVPASEPGQGFLAIDVPPSDNRPHMSVSEKRYFRRGTDGTRSLDHSEIRELMLATREGSLEVKCDIRTGMSSGDLRFGLSLILVLRNVGKVPVRAPYIRILDAGWNGNMPDLRFRVSTDGSYGIYSTPDVLIHLDDEIGLAEQVTGLDFRPTGQFELKSAVSAIKNNDQWRCLRMMPFSDMPPVGHTTSDRPIRATGFYGAENAAVKPFSFQIDKPELFKMFCYKMGIK